MRPRRIDCTCTRRMSKDLRAPKGHLHYHLELCMRQNTLDDLCGKYGIERVMTQMGTLPRRTANYDRGGGFSSFDEFSDVRWYGSFAGVAQLMT